jgi:hypothetical protein
VVVETPFERFAVLVYIRAYLVDPAVNHEESRGSACA